MRAIKLTVLVPVAFLVIGLNSCRKEANLTPVNGIQRDSMGTLALRRHFKCADPKKTIEYGLVAYYPFSGNADDWSGNGYNGTVMGATLTEGKSGCKNSAYSFNGTSDLIELPFLMGDSVTQFCVYARVKSTSTGTLWDSGADPGGYCTFKVDPTSVTYAEERTILIQGRNLVYADAQGSISPGTPVETWNDIVVNFNNGIIAIYVNGTLINLTYRIFDNLGLVQMPVPGINGVRVGAHFNLKSAILGIPFVDYLTGVVDEMRFYNRLLTPSEIDYLYKH